MNSSPHAWPPLRPTWPLAVLVSGGLDSAILLGEALQVFPAVHPIYIRGGAFWEEAEFAHLQRFLSAVHCPTLKPVVSLQMPITDLYGHHWSLTGANVPDARSADEAVFLPGRNVLLLAKALLWCLMHDVPELATAPLASNPFPDATDSFYEGFAKIVGQSVAGEVRVLRPYASLGLHKREVLLRGKGMPLQYTFSCISPKNGLHCGVCNKCAERKQGFAEAGLPDPTEYGSPG